MTGPLQVAPFDPAHRAIVHIATDELERELGLDARILDARYDHERQALRVLVHRPDLDYVHPGSEPRIIDRAAVTRRVPLAEAEPQFDATVTIDGAVIGVNECADPLAVTHVIIDPADFPTDGSPIRVAVSMNATRAGLRHVMRPIDLTPNDEQPSPPSGHDLMAIGEDAGPAAPGVDTSRPDDHGVIG